MDGATHETGTHEIAAAMGDAAAALLAALGDDVAARMRYPADDHAERTSWAFYPREAAGERFGGVPLHELSTSDRKLVWRLVETGTSTGAFAQIAAITALETVLDRDERHRISRWRDPGRYFVSVFGTPGPQGTWGWRFEGHHLSIHHTVIDGEVVASTPFFLGASPAIVRHHGRIVTRPVGIEEDAARELLALLDSEQRARAVVHQAPPPDMVVLNTPVVPLTSRPGDPPAPIGVVQQQFEEMADEHRGALAFDRRTPRGLPASAMSGEQRAALDEVIDLFVQRLPGPLAGAERARIHTAGIDGVHFAWAGTDRTDEPAYFRLQGPTLLVEYDRAQDAGNHVHSVWRDPVRDFANDVLGRHRRSSH